MSLIAIFIIISSYVTYGAHFDSGQWDLSHLTNSATFIAAVTGVGCYAGFESAASLGHEARDAHRQPGPQRSRRDVAACGSASLLNVKPGATLAQ